jgi:hypothetical protein
MENEVEHGDSTAELKNIMDLVADNRPARGAWAPGHYVCKCSYCSKHFIGDKRAVTCADCAYEQVELEAVEDDKVTDTKCCGWEVIKCPDDLISGHIEFETLSLCGEYICCGDECYQSWIFCPYCGRDFNQIIT